MVTEERGIAVVWVDPMTGCIYLKSPIDFVMVLNMKFKRGNVILKNNFSHKNVTKKIHWKSKTTRTILVKFNQTGRGCVSHKGAMSRVAIRCQDCNFLKVKVKSVNPRARQKVC